MLIFLFARNRSSMARYLLLQQLKLEVAWWSDGFVLQSFGILKIVWTGGRKTRAREQWKMEVITHKAAIQSSPSPAMLFDYRMLCNSFDKPFAISRHVDVYIRHVCVVFLKNFQIYFRICVILHFLFGMECWMSVCVCAQNVCVFQLVEINLYIRIYLWYVWWTSTLMSNATQTHTHTFTHSHRHETWKFPR